MQNKERVTVTVQRNGQRHKLEVETIDATEGRAVGTDRIALWAGAGELSPINAHFIHSIIFSLSQTPPPTPHPQRQQSCKARRR